MLSTAARVRVGATRSTQSSTARSFLVFYTTITGLTRTNWGTGVRAPQPLVSSGGEDDHLSPSPSPSPSHSKSPQFSKRRAPQRSPTPQSAKVHRAALKEAFPEGWSPPRKLSRAAMDGLRWLHAQDPKTCTTPVLAERFRISPEAVRRILKSKWQPTKEQRERLLQRERLQRDAWIAEKKQEERERQTKMLIERSAAGRQAAGQRRPRPQYIQSSRKPRGVDRNDKLSLT